MPWTPHDVERHEHKATKPALQELWTKVADESLERTGDECAPSGRRSATDLCLRIQRLKSLRDHDAIVGRCH